jgi:hypothetical protein
MMYWAQIVEDRCWLPVKWQLPHLSEAVGEVLLDGEASDFLQVWKSAFLRSPLIHAVSIQHV